jgi:quinol-cytochrome oxidoreductase complex cytochrome b subunit
MVVLLGGTVVLAFPDTLHHPDNLCYVDRYVTPKHIVPEWYFLPFYSMLRACSIKVLGVLLLGTAVLVYVVLLVVLSEGVYCRGIHQVAVHLLWRYMNLEVSRYSGILSMLWGCGYHLIWLLVGHLSV